MRQSHSTQAQSTASHCRLTSPAGEVRSPVIVCQITSRPRYQFLRYSERLDNFRTDFVNGFNLICCLVLNFGGSLNYILYYELC